MRPSRTSAPERIRIAPTYLLLVIRQKLGRDPLATLTNSDARSSPTCAGVSSTSCPWPPSVRSIRFIQQRLPRSARVRVREGRDGGEALRGRIGHLSARG